MPRKILATSSWDGTTKLWHVASGHELLTLKDPAGMVTWCAAFSPDGKCLATGSTFNQIGNVVGDIALWRAATNEQVLAMRTRAELWRRVLEIGAADGDQQKQAWQAVESYLDAQSPPDPRPVDFNLATFVVRALRQSGDNELAADAYNRLAQIARATNNEVLVRRAPIWQGAARFLTLTGSPVQLEGHLLDGAELDWNAYRDKPVLVIFWKTTSSACSNAVAHIQRLYQWYHDRGLNVIGVSVDRDRKTLAQNLSETPLPWATLYDRDPTTERPLANFYGITQFPTAILIDRKGRAVFVTNKTGELYGPIANQLGPLFAPRGTLTYSRRPHRDRRT